jgi:hypothetical protein
VPTEPLVARWILDVRHRDRLDLDQWIEECRLSGAWVPSQAPQLNQGIMTAFEC